jgi:hypothetical protein
MNFLHFFDPEEFERYKPAGRIIPRFGFVANAKRKRRVFSPLPAGFSVKFLYRILHSSLLPNYYQANSDFLAWI